MDTMDRVEKLPSSSSITRTPFANSKKIYVPGKLHDIQVAMREVSVDDAAGVPAAEKAWTGLVTELVASRMERADDRPRVVMSCGPVPLLKAVATLAAEHGWQCHVSLEEHMGCGYGACKGCVVPVRDKGEPGWRNATCCQEGPVFAAEDIWWDRYGAPVLPQVD